MAPVPGLKEEGNVYRPIQREGHPTTYMDRVEERKALEEVQCDKFLFYFAKFDYIIG